MQWHGLDSRWQWWRSPPLSLSKFLLPHDKTPWITYWNVTDQAGCLPPQNVSECFIRRERDAGLQTNPCYSLKMCLCRNKLDTSRLRCLNYVPVGALIFSRGIPSLQYLLWHNLCCVNRASTNTQPRPGIHFQPLFIYLLYIKFYFPVETRLRYTPSACQKWTCPGKFSTFLLFLLLSMD